MHLKKENEGDRHSNDVMKHHSFVILKDVCVHVKYIIDRNLKFFFVFLIKKLFSILAIPFRSFQYFIFEESLQNTAPPVS